MSADEAADQELSERAPESLDEGPGEELPGGSPRSHREVLVARIAELEDRWRRALADLDNMRKRYRREVERAVLEERMRVAGEFVRVVDDLERALSTLKEDPVAEGVRRVHEEALEILARLGFPRSDEVGVHFDPSKHDAVGTLHDPERDPGTVVDVVRAGYGEGESQIRPASVVVTTGPS